MTTLPVTSEQYPTPEEIHAQLLNDLRYAYGRLGVTVNVKKDSDHWIRMWAVANRLSLAIANGQVGLQDTNPLTSTGDALTAWAAVYGVLPRPATAAIGYVNISVLAPATTVNIPVAFGCTSASGIKYQTTTNAFYADGDPVQVEAVDTGEGTDLDADEIVTWDSAAIAYLGQTATVEAGGLSGGADEDDEEGLRTRLLRRLSSPAVGGNWAHVIELAEAASPAVTAAYVYPTARGPASYDVAIVGEPDDPVLSAAAVNQVAAAIVAEMPGCANLNCTSVAAELVDVVVNLDAPLPVHAGGAGGGWYDAIPWPSTADTPLARITAVDTTANTITVNSTNADAPYVGCRFAIWHPTEQTMYEFAAIGVAGGSGAYVITIDSAYATQLSWVTTWMYCSAGAEHLNEYAQALLGQMQLLGPGEKTANADILIYARRKPSPSLQSPNSLTSRALAAITAAYPEVLDAAYAARYATGTTTPLTTPSVPALVANAPRVLTLQSLSFRRTV